MFSLLWVAVVDVSTFRRRSPLDSAGLPLDIVKVSEKSGNSVFRFIVHKFSSRF